MIDSTLVHAYTLIAPMLKLNYHCILILVAGFCFTGLTTAYAQTYDEDKILDYHSDIRVNQDSSLTVIETISVWIEGSTLRKGIFREIPTLYKDQHGNIIRIGVKVLSVTRDGQPEPYYIEPTSSWKRIYTGERFVFLKKQNKHVYTISYKVTRALGFYQDHDELYWNVTGNGWIFPIGKTSATIHLPSNIDPLRIDLAAYTGKAGEKEENCILSINGDGTSIVSTGSTLAEGEGLAITVSFPKGYVREPSRNQKIMYLLLDNLALIALLAALVIILPYYFLIWLRVGRDLPAGVIIPLYSPPDNLSPAAVRYIYKMGYDDKIIDAAYASMAVKGFWNIKLDTGNFSFTKNYAYDVSILSDEERAIAETFVKTGDQITLNDYKRRKITRAVNQVKKILKNKYEKQYFNSNSIYSNIGMTISAIALITMLVNLYIQGNTTALVSVLFGSICIVCAGAIIIPVIMGQWRIALSRTRNSKTSLFKPLAVTLFFIPLSLLVLLVPFAINILLPVIASILVGFNYLFRHLLKAPTREGRDILDRIEGFKLFLSYGEKERLNTMSHVINNPDVFEKFLPYAFALDIERSWSLAFIDSLEATGLSKDEYKPAWYSGDNFFDFAKMGFSSSSIVKVGDPISWYRDGFSTYIGELRGEKSQRSSRFADPKSGRGKGSSGRGKDDSGGSV